MLLTKMSSPSWEKELNTYEDVFEVLDKCVCSSCKITSFEEMKSYFEDNEFIDSFTDEDVEDELDSCCVSEDYENLSVDEKGQELLSTACGCEYMLEL